ISNTFSDGLVEASSLSVGGLVGWNSVDKRHDPDSPITNSHSEATVNGASVVGGLVGSNSGSRAPIKNSSSKGNVTGTIHSIGGFVGENRMGPISNSHSTGDVTGDSKVGGFIGHSYEREVTIENSYSTG